MNPTIKAFAARLAILALLLYLAPVSVLASEPGARLEGLVVDADGRPSAGATVYLFDDEGRTRAQATATEDGVYSLRDVPAGAYGMGLQTADGAVAPVSSPPIRLAKGELVRRDLKLVQADEASVDRALTANYGFGSWFGDLSGGEKVGLIVGFVAFAGLVYAAFSSDDDDFREEPASPEENF
jgi:hypothetical protein